MRWKEPRPLSSQPLGALHLRIMANKELERWYLERFILTCPDFPAGEIKPSEQPDFLVGGKDTTVGIELTRFFVEHRSDERPRQEQESLRSRVLEEADRIHAAQDPRYVHVNVLFSLDSNLHKSDVVPIGAAIAHAVVNAPVDIGAFVTVDSRLPEGVNSMMIARSNKLTQSSWHFDDVGFTPEVTSSELQRIIRSKDDNLSQYRQQAPSHWLLIIVDGSGLSSTADFPEKVLHYGYESSFDRAYLFFNAQSSSIELQTRD